MTLSFLFYVVAIIASALAAFGLSGLVMAPVGALAVWIAVAERWGKRLSPISRLAVCGVAIITLYLTLPTSSSSGFWQGYRLRQLALAVDEYNSMKPGSPLVTSSNVDRVGRPVASWRVKILPFLEEYALYDSYNFDQAWDEGENLDVLTKPPEMLLDGHRNGTTGFAHYEIVVAVADDGQLRPLAIVDSPRPVPWSKPSYLTADEFLDLITEKDSELSWDFGHHEQKWFSDQGWGFKAVLVNDDPQKAFGEHVYNWDVVDERLLEVLNAAAKQPRIAPVRIAPTKTWRFAKHRTTQMVAQAIFVALWVAPFLFPFAGHRWTSVPAHTKSL
ncbi:MAG: DUF1559 domain-containing protein [Planctomycetales bacterium]|nr:DUF1559 domain-containing protein [Planctomycetales bacterium]MCA9168809.1 DUF1559 domain-containing protein [Planctomycetales bacterium]